MKIIFRIEYKTPTGIPITELATNEDSAKSKLECLYKHRLSAEAYMIEDPEIYWVEMQMRLKPKTGKCVKVGSVTIDENQVVPYNWYFNTQEPSK